MILMGRLSPFATWARPNRPPADVWQLSGTSRTHWHHAAVRQPQADVRALLAA
jgi:hypothetical protein